MGELDMPRYAITCGCGRTMTLDGRNGYNAYRCGCGVRIRIAEVAAASATCSVDECRTASVTGNKIRLCLEHKDEVTMTLAHDIARTDLKHLAVLQEQGASRWTPPLVPVYEGPAVAPTEAAVVREVPAAGQHEPVVYFLRNGDRVKIGYTTHLAARITALSLRRANVILALDGGRELEALMHRRFHGHRIRGTEWFNFAGEIEAFVRARRGLPKADSGPTCKTP